MQRGHGGGEVVGRSWTGRDGARMLVVQFLVATPLSMHIYISHIDAS